MIELRRVTKRYPMAGGVLTVLHGIDLYIESGEFVSIMGPSGSGKSTLMHILGCLDVPSTGEYLLRGESVHDSGPDDLARIRNREIGFVFQNFYLLPRLTALRNVELPLVYSGVNPRDRRERAMELLSQVGLTDRASHYPSALSGGQRQRVAIARALANRPSLLLADEPTGALDSRTGREVMEVFQRLNDTGATIVIITHDATVAEFAKRVIHIQDGRVIGEGGVS